MVFLLGVLMSRPAHAADWAVGTTDGQTEYRWEGASAPGDVVVFPTEAFAGRYEIAVDGRVVVERTRLAWRVPPRTVPLPEGASTVVVRVEALRPERPPAGPLPPVEAQAVVDRFWAAALSARLIDPFGAGFFLFTALYHLQLFARRRTERAYLWFSLVCLGALGVNLTGIVNELGVPPLPFLPLVAVNFACASLCIGALTEFTAALVGSPGPGLRRLLHVGLVLPVIAEPWDLPWLVLFWVLALLVSAVALVLAAWRGDPEARTVVGGMAVFASLLSSVIGIEAAGWEVHDAMFALPAFAALILSMAVSLSNRFERTHRELDALRLDLEARVDARTRELADANARLASFNELLTDRVRVQVEELLKQRRLWRFFPKAVREHILSGEAEVAPVTERRLVTVLFADLTGFTAFSEGVEPERATATLNAWIDRMVAEIERHDGVVDKVMGDGIMALWGATEVTDARLQAERAIEAAIAMQRAMEPLRARWATAGVTHRFDIRIGLHQDLVAVGNVGTENLMSFTAIGSGVNLASRLESSAPPGRILVSETLAAVVADRFAFSPPEERRLKGVRDAVAVRILDPADADALAAR